ncbi:MAG TPA: hypothetical protein ENN03_01870 [bacterium]|nr:hypothetical protein [bacterium]
MMRFIRKCVCRKCVCVGLAVFLPVQALAVDRVITRQKIEYRGTFVNRTQQGLVMRTVEGTLVVIPQNEISKIYREDKSIWDFETGTRYYLKKSLPFLPFTLLGAASGAYAVHQYNNFRDEQERVKDTPDDVNNITDRSNTHLALCIVSGIFAVGSIYIAFRPMEVKVPLGRINISANPRGITLALRF